MGIYYSTGGSTKKLLGITYSTANPTRFIMGIIFSIWIVILTLITLNTALSIADKDGCFRHGIVTKKKGVCRRFKNEYKQISLDKCPGKYKELREKGYCGFQK